MAHRAAQRKAQRIYRHTPEVREYSTARQRESRAQKRAQRAEDYMTSQAGAPSCKVPLGDVADHEISSLALANDARSVTDASPDPLSPSLSPAPRLSPTLRLTPSPTQTRLVLLQHNQEILRATLPSPYPPAHFRAPALLVQALSLWLDQTLCVVLCADETHDWFGMGFCDDLGQGATTVYYQTRVVAPSDIARLERSAFGNPTQLELQGVR